MKGCGEEQGPHNRVGSQAKAVFPLPILEGHQAETCYIPAGCSQGMEHTKEEPQRVLWPAEPHLTPIPQIRRRIDCSKSPSTFSPPFSPLAQRTNPIIYLNWGLSEEGDS